MKNSITTISTPWLSIPEAAAYARMDYKHFKMLVDSGVVKSRMRSERVTLIHTDWIDELILSYPPGAKTPSM